MNTPSSPPPAEVTNSHSRFGWSGDAKLRIDRTTPIGSMGSCFARRLKDWLVINRFNYVLTNSNLETPHGSADWERVFNTHCVHQEISRLVDGIERPLHELPDGRVVDPWRKNKIFETQALAAENIQAYLKGGLEVLKSMSVFVITLGLSEVWFDRESELAFAEYPKFGDVFTQERIELRFVDAQTNLRNLDLAIRLLTKANPSLQIILTVSPIPLRATFFDRSVFASNSLSKSALLQAAIELSESTKNVHYFPSYEIALLLNDGPTFEWDGRHVNEETVELIMKYFKEMFVS